MLCVTMFLLKGYTLCLCVYLLFIGLHLITKSPSNLPRVCAYLNTGAMLSVSHLFFSLQYKKQLRALGTAEGPGNIWPGVVLDHPEPSPDNFSVTQNTFKV